LIERMMSSRVDVTARLRAATDYAEGIIMRLA
jgi:hypothetical protein